MDSRFLVSGRRLLRRPRPVGSVVTVSADPLRAAVLSFGVDELGTTADTPIDVEAFERLLEWAVNENLVGLLWHAAPKLFVLSEGARSQLDAAYSDTALSVLSIEASARDVSTVFVDAGIDFRVLKGLATSHLLYPHPSWRAFRDVDVVVRPDDLDRAIHALAPITEEGSEVQAGPVRSALMKERQITDVRGVAIDVHRAVQGSLVTTSLPVDDVFAEPQSFCVGDTTFLAPPPAVMFVHAVLHSSSGGAQQSTLPDVARLARLVDPGSPRLHSLLSDPWTRDLFTWSLDRAREVMPLSAAWHDYCDTAGPSGRRQRMLDLAHRDDARLGLTNVLIGPRRIRRALEVVWPTNEYLAYHEITRTENMRRVLHRGWQVIGRKSPR